MYQKDAAKLKALDCFNINKNSLFETFPSLPISEEKNPFYNI